jgi:hypothetical protein
MRLVCTSILIPGISDRLVLAQYLFRLAEAQSTPWKLKGVAVASYSVAVLGEITYTDNIRILTV